MPSAARSSVGVRGHDRRVLAAHLGDQRAQRRAGVQRGGDRVAGLGRARERDAVDAGVDERAADRVVAVDEVEHAGRQPGLDGQLGELRRRPRRLLGRLHDHRVAGDERAGGHVDREREREVERADHREHAVRAHHRDVVLALGQPAERDAVAVARARARCSTSRSGRRPPAPRAPPPSGSCRSRPRRRRRARRAARRSAPRRAAAPRCARRAASPPTRAGRRARRARRRRRSRAWRCARVRRCGPGRTDPPARRSRRPRGPRRRSGARAASRGLSRAVASARSNAASVAGSAPVEV